jgi:hypothetical protein
MAETMSARLAANVSIWGAVERAHLLDERDGIGVRAGQPAGVVPEPQAPVGRGAPGGRLQHQPRLEAARELGVGDEVAPERRLAILGTQQIERGEVGQGETVVIDERRLDAAVGQEQGVGELRQLVSIARHELLLAVRRSARDTALVRSDGVGVPVR